MQNLVTFIGEVCATFGILNLPQSSDIGQNTGDCISDFRISGQTLIKVNCHNSRTTDDNEMKLEPVTKPGKRNKTTLKKFGDDVVSGNCDVIVILPIYGQFWAIRKPDSGYIVCKTYIFFNSNLLSYRNWKQNWKISNTALTMLLWVKVLLLPENAKIMQTSAKLRGFWY